LPPVAYDTKPPVNPPAVAVVPACAKILLIFNLSNPAFNPAPNKPAPNPIKAPYPTLPSVNNAFVAPETLPPNPAASTLFATNVPAPYPAKADSPPNAAPLSPSPFQLAFQINFPSALVENPDDTQPQTAPTAKAINQNSPLGSTYIIGLFRQ